MNVQTQNGLASGLAPPEGTGSNILVGCIVCMSNKEFCESGKHGYHEVNIVRSVFEDDKTLWILVACKLCDSQFLREVERPL